MSSRKIIISVCSALYFKMPVKMSLKVITKAALVMDIAVYIIIIMDRGYREGYSKLITTEVISKRKL